MTRPHLYLVSEPEPAATCAHCQHTCQQSDMTQVVVTTMHQGEVKQTEPIQLCLACTLQFSALFNHTDKDAP